MRNCGRCHTCGADMTPAMDGEEFCPACGTYNRYRSHGWNRSASGPSECPPLMEHLRAREAFLGPALDRMRAISDYMDRERQEQSK